MCGLAAAYDFPSIELTRLGEACRAGSSSLDTLMKEHQDHSVVTRWGGRAERYRDFPRTENRAHDTFGVQPLQFGHAYHYEAWVLERFAPDTQSMTRTLTEVSAVIDGVELRATATFVVTGRDGTQQYVLATKAAGVTSELGKLRRIAKANGATVKHLTRDEIRAQIDDFWFWERLRQVATMWVNKGHDLDDILVALVISGRTSLVDICAQMDAPRDLIRARLARLHVEGRLLVQRVGGELRASVIEGRA